MPEASETQAPVAKQPQLPNFHCGFSLSTDTNMIERSYQSQCLFIRYGDSQRTMSNSYGIIAHSVNPTTYRVNRLKITSICDICDPSEPFKSLLNTRQRPGQRPTNGALSQRSVHAYAMFNLGGRGLSTSPYCMHHSALTGPYRSFDAFFMQTIGSDRSILLLNSCHTNLMRSLDLSRLQLANSGDKGP